MEVSDSHGARIRLELASFCPVACLAASTPTTPLYHMGVGQNPIIINWNGMNIHLPSIFGFTKYQAFDP